MSKYLIVGQADGKPRRIDPTATPQYGEIALEIPSRHTLDYYAFATFDAEARELVFERKHYISVDKDGNVLGDVLTNHPVYPPEGKPWEVVDVTDQSKHLLDSQRPGCFRDYVCDLKEKPPKMAPKIRLDVTPKSR